MFHTTSHLTLPATFTIANYSSTWCSKLRWTGWAF